MASALQAALMVRVASPFALLLAITACAPPPSSPPPPSAASLVRVVTWNVHDLFDEVDRLTPPGDEDLVFTRDFVEGKLQRIGAVIRRLDPDIVVLQEVENVALLDRLASGPLAGGGYRTFLREGRDPRGIDVGVLSRLAFEPGPSHLDDLDPDGERLWSRDVPEIHVSSTARELVVFGAHLVSRLDPADDGRRRLQAVRLRALVDALRSRGGGEPPVVLLVGDLNDVPSSAALAPLLADGDLDDLGAGIAPVRAWTWSGKGAHERIDYALVPSSDRPLVLGADVLGGPEVDAASDHRPLVIDLWLGARCRLGGSGPVRAPAACETRAAPSRYAHGAIPRGAHVEAGYRSGYAPRAHADAGRTPRPQGLPQE